MQAAPQSTKRPRPLKVATTPPPGPIPLPRTYTKAQVLAMVNVSWRTVLRWIHGNDFPKPKKLSACTQVFLADAVDAWIFEKLNT